MTRTTIFKTPFTYNSIFQQLGSSTEKYSSFSIFGENTLLPFGDEISHHTESAKCRWLQYSLLLHVIAVNSQLQCLHRLSIRVNCKESFVWADAIYGLDAGLAWSGPEAHAQYLTRPAARILHCLDLLGRALKLTGRKCTNGQLGRLHKLQYIKPMPIVQPRVA